jgi:hypothetical protein
MYSEQLLRVHHDEWLRQAEARRLVKLAHSNAQPQRRSRPRRDRFSAVGLRRPLRHA